MSPILVPLLALLSSVSAQIGTLGEVGLNSPGPSSFSSNATSANLFETEGRTPNITNFLQFPALRIYNGSGEIAHEDVWTWRINLTEVAVPDPLSAPNASAPNLPGHLRVANTQWSLEWPDKDQDNLVAWAQANDMNVTFRGLISQMPSNITKNYNDSSAIGSCRGFDDCIPVFQSCRALLSDKCVLSLQNSIFNATDLSEIETSGLKGCGNTLDMGQNMLSLGATITGNDSTPGWGRGDSFLYATSDAYNVTDSTEFDKAKGAVHILLLKVTRDGRKYGKYVNYWNVLCRIAEPPVTSLAGSVNPNLVLGLVAFGVAIALL